MSKTYLIQVEKVKALAAGIRAHHDMVKDRGITLEQIEQMERHAAEAEHLNAEVENLRKQASMKVREANVKLIEMKETWLPIKNRVKSSFDPLKWPMFGIQDKR